MHNAQRTHYCLYLYVSEVTLSKSNSFFTFQIDGILYLDVAEDLGSNTESEVPLDANT